jgi:hypothetical protein
MISPGSLYAPIPSHKGLPMYPLRTLLACTLACASFSSIASELPRPAQFETSDQQKAASVRHWQVIANDLAAVAVPALGTAGARGVYVAPSETASVFDYQLRTFLVDALHDAGLRVLTAPREGALELNVSQLAVTHAGPVDTSPTFLTTALAAGVLVARNIAISDWQAGLLATSFGVDVSRAALKQPTRTELAITLSVADKGEYLVRKSNVYYVSAADISLYSPSGKSFRIEGGAQ